MPPVKLSARQLTVGTILGMGLLALFAEPFSSVVFDFLFGDMWRGSVRQALIDWGLSSHLVTHHVSFILLAVPHWSLWILVSFCLGLSTRRLAKVAAISFILWRLFLDLFVCGCAAAESVRTRHLGHSHGSDHLVRVRRLVPGATAESTQ
jgi:hypothetical protein